MELNGRFRIPVTGESVFLVCPACGFEYVHPLCVRVATGEEAAITDKNGTRVVKHSAEADDAKAKRGVRILVEYGCEHGHHGNIVVQFHKGQTFIQHEVLPDLKREEWGSTLWRD